jgi:hypothetical protein
MGKMGRKNPLEEVQWRQYELPVLSARWERRCGVDELRE